jgi:hypothetical protein
MDSGLLSGNIEAPRQGERVGRCGFLVTGWALDAVAPLPSVLLTLNDRVVATVTPSRPRPDLAARHPHIPHAATCGWQAVLDLSSAPAGPAVLGLTALTVAGHTLRLAAVELTLTADPPDATRPACAFTIVQNESFFLPRWLDYYGRHFDAADLFVLDHQTTDGSTTGLEGRCQVIRVHRSMSFDHYWLKRTVERFQAFLLTSYETVLFAEADEFILPHPERYRGLADYIRRMPGPLARCTGFEVVHDPSEPALRPAEPLLRQRTHWHPSALYSKTLLARHPLTWVVGFHEVVDPPMPALAPDPDLVLAHLHRVDFDRCLARHEAAARRRWSAADVEKGLGFQSRIVEPSAFAQWFHHDADRTNGPRQRVPACFQELL